MYLQIESLHDDCLLHIFDRVPLLDLLRIDQVCPRWKDLFPSACARRRTLALIIGGTRLDEMSFSIPFNSNFKISFDGHQPYFGLPEVEQEASFKMSYLMPPDSSSVGRNEVKYTEQARFRYAHLSGQLVTHFKNLFSNVDTLVVINPQCVEAELHSVINLIGLWSLRILKLWLRTLEINWTYQYRPEHHPVRTLLHRINAKQSSLQQLTLDIDGLDEYRRYRLPSESYSFAAQLKVGKLCLGWYGTGNFISNIVHRFDRTKLRTVGLANYSFLKEDTLNPELEFTRTKVCQLYGGHDFESIEQFYELCWRFPALTTLQMDWSPNVTFTQLVSNLASLEQLTHLKLNITHEHSENPFELVGGDEEKFRRISLPQVRVLELHIWNSTHHQFESLSPLAFPSVEVIVLWVSSNSSQCIICQPYEDENAQKHCHRLLILSLKKKFVNSLVRLYSKHGKETFVEWSKMQTEQVDLFKSDQVDSFTKTTVILVSLFVALFAVYLLCY